MASLVDELVSVLIEEEKLYSALLECAEKKIVELTQKGEDIVEEKLEV